MVALQSFSENIRKTDREDVSPLFDKIEELSRELEKYLRSGN
jgi:hypothetical protein